MAHAKRICLAVVACAICLALCLDGFSATPSSSLSAYAEEISALAKSLKEGNPVDRRDALTRLEGFGLDAAPALEALVGALDDPDAYVRGNAAEVLGRLEQDAEPAVAALIKRLGESKYPMITSDFVGGPPDMGLYAAIALGRIGSAAVEPLKACLADERVAVRANAAYALGNMGVEGRSAADPLLAATMDKDKSVRLEAVWALGRIQANPQRVVPGLVGRLADEDLSVRHATVESLAALRPIRPLAVAGLTHALADEDGAVQARAAEALGEWGPAATPAVGPLTGMLRSEASHPVPFGHPYQFRPVSAVAANALGQLGPAAKSAMPELLAAIGDSKRQYDDLVSRTENRSIGPAAMHAAARIAPDSAALLAALEKALDDDRVADDAVRALASLGPRAKRSVPLLKKRLERVEPDERLNIALAMVEIEPDEPLGNKTLLDRLDDLDVDNTDCEFLVSVLRRSPKRYVAAVPALSDLFASSGDDVRIAGVLALFGDKARNAVPALIKAIPNSFDADRVLILSSLGRIGSVDMPEIQKALQDDKHEDIRAGVAEAIGYSPGSLTLLSKAIRDPSPVVRVGAVRGLEHRGKEGVDTMVKALADPSARVRLAAVNALAARPEAAERSLLVLPKLLQDDSRTVRKAAWKAIDRLEKAGDSPRTK